MSEFADLLNRIDAKVPGAVDELARLAYPELHRLARARLYDSGPRTLMNTTSLVHECYLRLVQGKPVPFADRKRFFAYASKIMRSIIVDTVREANAQKRAPEGTITELGTTALAQPAPVADVLGVDCAMQELAKIDPELTAVVEMRFFGGFTESEIAEVLGSSERTVRRQWEKARIMLADLLAPDDI